MIDVILWDLDGTIQDSESLAKASTRYGFEKVLGREPTEDEYEQLLGRPLPVVYREWFSEELVERILMMMSEYYLDRKDQLVCYKGVPELLAALKLRGYRMGIVTSKRRVNAIDELKAKGLDSWFEVIIAQEDTDLHKPSPDPLLAAALQLNAAPERCVYIGDQPTDIRAAHAAQMLSIAALWGEGSLDRVESVYPTRLVYKPNDILNALAEISSNRDSFDHSYPSMK
ncbi:HAD-IA family hydrolase [Paenibacillus sp. PR3]|uniref:HAD-IA family hydrolase n=1 Tax=Paenibacillus terricola TaxID=2763503 RepID=A0ABR8N190_9BACL|nr:HAD-IA family hydrolase [Paenibacillus terricola]MBD3921954.1 HAD-IA family hydrolase [Paenibacillus terricola]